MGKDSFPFPKDEEILSEKLKSFSTNKSIILDFFAGSGTTLHATMQLNAEDGGHRQCILITNNENNICEEVTYERNKRVIQGYTNAKGEEVAGLTKIISAITVPDLLVAAARCRICENWLILLQICFVSRKTFIRNKIPLKDKRPIKMFSAISMTGKNRCL